VIGIADPALARMTRLIGFSGSTRFTALAGKFVPLAEDFLRERPVSWSCGDATTNIWLSAAELGLLGGQSRAGGHATPMAGQNAIFQYLTGHSKPLDTNATERPDFDALKGYEDGLSKMYGWFLYEFQNWTHSKRPQTALAAFIGRITAEPSLPPDDPSRFGDDRLLNDKKNLRGLTYLAGMNAFARPGEDDGGTALFSTIAIATLGIEAAPVNGLTEPQRELFGKLLTAGQYVALSHMAKDQFDLIGVANY
jgi:hypothetical protein